ncbi:DUF2160 domain-containing protein [Methylobacterium sp.]|uniref:DUF2160 domain-containing protein n=1 Tax=Methylobacterium sp. TaxID=409 RepID=UPI00272E9AC8|nr:DUF2160 family membrane protein [Methylobacterium sp.]
MPDFAWMAWTWQTAVNTAVTAAHLPQLTAPARSRPYTEKAGIRRIPTTRGDRLFLTLVGTAFINLAWLGLVGPSLEWALALSLVYGAAMFRFA